MQELSKQDGKMSGGRTPNCLHAKNAACIHCLPKEPYDAKYLEDQVGSNGLFVGLRPDLNNIVLYRELFHLQPQQKVQNFVFNVSISNQTFALRYC